jgi:hypothetical protein
MASLMISDRVGPTESRFSQIRLSGVSESVAATGPEFDDLGPSFAGGSDAGVFEQINSGAFEQRFFWTGRPDSLRQGDRNG